MKNMISTTKAAKLLGVAIASISKWIDSGELKAGKTPGGHRRIDKKDLAHFLKRHKLGIPKELKTSHQILIVDDEASIVEWITQEITAEHSDFRILHASDGYSAGEIVASSHPDVVILDLRMPGLDGFDVCKRIKSNKKTDHIAVIAMTAHHSEEAQARILECGARAYFLKPLDITLLMKEIESTLEV